MTAIATAMMSDYHQQGHFGRLTIAVISASNPFPGLR
jgi:hypothetical protein